MELETRHLHMRPWRPSDAHALYLHAKNPDVGHLGGWAPHLSQEQSAQLIEDVLMVDNNLAITYKPGSHPDDPVGSIGITDSAHSALADEGEGELGFWIASKLWGHGLASEAASEVMRWGYEDLGLKRIWAKTLLTNERAKRVLQKLGMFYRKSEERETPWGMEPVDVFSLTKEEWLRQLYR